MILDQIAADTRLRVEAKKKEISLEEVKRDAQSMEKNTGFPFETALRKPDLSFICEVKKASPSKGIIAEEFPYLQIAKEYDEAGADAISCLTEPKYFLGKDEYLKEIAKEVKNVVAIKEASGNISQVAKLASLADGCLDIYSGNDDQVLPLLSLGGKGVISVWSNVAPAKVHDMVASYMDGDIEKAQKIQLEAIELIDALFCEVNPIPVKAAMNMLGYKAGSLRAPLTEMTDANKERLRKAMENYGLL